MLARIKAVGQNGGNLKMRTLILFIILILPGLIFAEKLADLAEVMQPGDFHVYGDRIFIGDNNTIHIYSLKDFKQIKQFGREGEGPGEFKFNIRLEVFPDKLVVNTMGKLIFFSHDGSLIKEFKTKSGMSNIRPVGPNFVASVYEGSKTQKMNLYDKNLKFMDTFYEGSLGQTTYWHSDAKKNDVFMVKDYVELEVYKDRIYVGDTRKGFYFAVYDCTGKKLYDVKNQYKPLKISEEYKKEKIRIQQERPGWDRIKNKINIRFPEYFPAYHSVRFSDDKIYFVTFLNSKGKDETIVTDLNGKFLGKTCVPSDIWIFSISKDKLYWLVENEDKEMWELYGEDVKQLTRGN